MRRYIGPSLAAAVIMLLALTGRAAAASSSLSGIVVDGSNNVPLTNVFVQAFGSNGQRLAYVTTDQDGRFLMPSLEPGTYRFEMSHPGYATAIWYDVRINGGRTLHLYEPVGMDSEKTAHAKNLAACERLVWPSQTASLYVVCAGK
jgi:hypothetical protein